MSSTLLPTIFHSKSEDDTFQFGKEIAKELHPNDIVLFYGELGSGKTSLIKGISSYFGANKEMVTSPTFTLMQQYLATLSLFHFDLYRLKDEKEFIDLGFEEYFYQDGICLIEWAEKIVSIIPSSIKITLTHIAPNQRKIEVKR